VRDRPAANFPRAKMGKKQGWRLAGGGEELRICGQNIFGWPGMIHHAIGTTFMTISMNFNF
jgi:hypothetical protein